MKTQTTFVAIVLLALAFPAAPATENAGAIMSGSGGLRRCIGSDGVPIFTDRRCEDLQATESVAPPEVAVRAGVVLRVRSCARNQDDLLFGVRAALENHDANRLAEFYHWSGMGTAEGYRLMQRLSSFSDRPLVDVQLLSSPTPLAQDAYWSQDDPEVISFDDSGNYVPPPPRIQHPARLLRVDQMRGNNEAASQVTYFHLISNAGCWWLRF
ncbi:MAG: hypothetical protein ABIW30_02155 [Arenimonas sp.]